MALSSERLEARRRHIVEVAQALIREGGDAGFSMAMLAQRARVSAATPYNLLGSKSEILRLVVRDDVKRFAKTLEGHVGETPLQSLLNAADLLVDHYESDRAFNIGLFRAAFSTDVPEVLGILSTESSIQWKRLVDAAIKSGEVSSIVRSRQLTDALLRIMGGVAQTWLAERWPADRFALEISLSARLVLASVSAPPQRTRMIREIANLQAGIDTLLVEISGQREGTSPVD